MSKIVSNELVSVSYGNSIDKINEIIGKCDDMSLLLSTFIANSVNLKGRGYDALRKKIFLYIDAVIEQKSLLSNLYYSILDANGLLYNYTEGYDVIDDKYKDELYDQITKIRSSIYYLETAPSDEIKKYYNIEEGNISKNIESLKLTLGKLEEYYKLVAGLGAADAKAASNLDIIKTNANNFGADVLRINPLEFKNNYYSSIHFGQLDTRSRLLIERAMISWPNTLSQDRINVINDAVEMTQYNITYSQKYRMSLKREFEEGNYDKQMYADCSSFVSFIYQQNGATDEFGNPVGMWSTTGLMAASKAVFEHQRIWETVRDSNYNLEYISRVDQLIPGDLIMGFVSSQGGDNNHVAIYIGRDTDDKLICIDCSGRGGRGHAIQVSTHDIVLPFRKDQIYYIRYKNF